MSFVKQLTTAIRRVGSVTTGLTFGKPGTADDSGYLRENEKNPKLRGDRKYTTYSNNLANVAIVSAGTRYIFNLIAKADWTFEPALVDGVATEESKRFAQLMTQMRDDMRTPWVRIVRRASTYYLYGFSTSEIVIGRTSEGFIGATDIVPIPQQTVTKWDRDGFEILGIIQEDPKTFEEIYIPRIKLLYAVDDTFNDSPEGFGVFRQIAESCDRLRGYIKLESYGFETDLNGTPVGRAPLSAIEQQVKAGKITEKEKESLLDAMRSFINDRHKTPSRGILMDSAVYETKDETGRPSTTPKWDVQTINSNPASMEAISRTIERVNREIARALGVEGLLLGSTSVGSQALATDKSFSSDLMVESILTTVKEVIRKDLFGAIWELNGWPKELMPTIRTEAVQFRNVQEISQVIRDLAISGAKIMPSDPIIDELRELMGLSKQDPADVEFLRQMVEQLNQAQEPNVNANNENGREGVDNGASSTD